MSMVAVNNISFSYPDSKIVALENVSFKIEQGEYVAILGMNGSGKSTLGRIISGLLFPTKGSLCLQQNVRCGMVFQWPDNQIVAGIVKNDTSFGPKNLNFTPVQVEQSTKEALDSVGLLNQFESKTHQLSQGQKQKLALAGIKAMNPDLFVLDEVTSMIDAQSRTYILDLFEQWYRQGATLLHITHDIEEAAKATRILAIEDGKLVFDGSTKEFFEKKSFVSSLFGKDYSFPKEDYSKKTQTVEKCKEAALVFDKITFGYDNTNKTKDKIFKDFSLEIKKGCLTALMGSSGSGKSTLLELAAGLLEAQSGCVKCSSVPVLALQACERALFEEFAADDVAFGPKNEGLSGIQLLKRVRFAMEAADIPFDTFAERRTFSLSGGQKRKLSLASIIALDAEILLFDEPTAGLDAKSRRSVMQTLKSLTESGKTVVFTTHRQEEALEAHYSVCIEDTQLQMECNTSLPPVQKRGGLQLLDFLRNCGTNFSVGSVKKSAIQALPALWKYIVFLFLFVASFVTKTIPLAATFFVASFAYAVLARYPVVKMIKSLLKILPWVLLFFVLQMFFLPTDFQDKVLFSVGVFVLTVSKLHSTLMMFFHLLTAFITLAVFVYSINEQQVLEGLENLLKPLTWFKIPVRHVTMVAGIVYRFVPLLAEEAALIIKVQIIRGGLGDTKGFVKKIKKLLPLIVPLFIRTLKRADVLAEALTARFYS